MKSLPELLCIAVRTSVVVCGGGKDKKGVKSCCVRPQQSLVIPSISVFSSGGEVGRHTTKVKYFSTLTAEGALNKTL